MAGVGVSGNNDDVWAFRFACSSAKSPLEHYIFKSNEIINIIYESDLKWKL